MEWRTDRNILDWLFPSPDHITAKGWHRKFAWLPADLNHNTRNGLRHWVWLRYFWQRFDRSTVDDYGYGGYLYERRLEPPDQNDR